jgi:hypothetical protein
MVFQESQRGEKQSVIEEVLLLAGVISLGIAFCSCKGYSHLFNSLFERFYLISKSRIDNNQVKLLYRTQRLYWFVV